MNNEQTTQTPEKKSNLIQPKREFGLESSPHAYIISVHIRNMMATMGEEYVRSVLVELFLKEQPKTIFDAMDKINER